MQAFELEHHLKAIEEDGYTVLENVAPPELVAALRERFERHTRGLARGQLAYFTWVFAGLPACLLALGPEGGILAWLPGFALLHGLTLWCLARAHAQLRPDARGDREFYPPGEAGAEAGIAARLRQGRARRAAAATPDDDPNQGQ